MNQKSTSNLAIIGLAMSLHSLIINPLGLVGFTGLLLSILGLKQCKEEHYKGDTLATIGIAIGGFTTILVIFQLTRGISLNSYSITLGVLIKTIKKLIAIVIGTSSRFFISY